MTELKSEMASNDIVHFTNVKKDRSNDKLDIISSDLLLKKHLYFKEEVKKSDCNFKDLVVKHNSLKTKCDNLEKENLEFQKTSNNYLQTIKTLKSNIEANDTLKNHLEYKIKYLESSYKKLQETTTVVNKKLVKQQACQTNCILKFNKMTNTDSFEIPDPLKNKMIDKSVLTDDISATINNEPFPIFCSECSNLITPAPLDQIIKVMTRPPPEPLSTEFSQSQAKKIPEMKQTQSSSVGTSNHNEKTLEKNLIPQSNKQCIDSMPEKEEAECSSIDQLKRKLVKLEKKLDLMKNQSSNRNCCSKNIQFLVSYPSNNEKRKKQSPVKRLVKPMKLQRKKNMKTISTKWKIEDKPMRINVYTPKTEVSLKKKKTNSKMMNYLLDTSPIKQFCNKFNIPSSNLIEDNSSISEKSFFSSDIEEEAGNKKEIEFPCSQSSQMALNNYNHPCDFEKKDVSQESDSKNDSSVYDVYSKQCQQKDMINDESTCDNLVSKSILVKESDKNVPAAKNVISCTRELDFSEDKNHIEVIDDKIKEENSLSYIDSLPIIIKETNEDLAVSNNIIPSNVKNESNEKIQSDKSSPGNVFNCASDIISSKNKCVLPSTKALPMESKNATIEIDVSKLESKNLSFTSRDQKDAKKFNEPTNKVFDFSPGKFSNHISILAPSAKMRIKNCSQVEIVRSNVENNDVLSMIKNEEKKPVNVDESQYSSNNLPFKTKNDFLSSTMIDDKSKTSEDDNQEDLSNNETISPIKIDEDNTTEESNFDFENFEEYIDESPNSVKRKSLDGNDDLTIDAVVKEGSDNPLKKRRTQPFGVDGFKINSFETKNLSETPKKSSDDLKNKYIVEIKPIETNIRYAFSKADIQKESIISKCSKPIIKSNVLVNNLFKIDTKSPIKTITKQKSDLNTSDGFFSFKKQRIAHKPNIIVKTKPYNSTNNQLKITEKSTQEDVKETTNDFSKILKDFSRTCEERINYSKMQKQSYEKKVNLKNNANIIIPSNDKTTNNCKNIRSNDKINQVTSSKIEEIEDSDQSNSDSLKTIDEEILNIPIFSIDGFSSKKELIDHQTNTIVETEFSNSTNNSIKVSEKPNQKNIQETIDLYSDNSDDCKIVCEGRYDSFRMKEQQSIADNLDSTYSKNNANNDETPNNYENMQLKDEIRQNPINEIDEEIVVTDFLQMYNSDQSNNSIETIEEVLDNPILSIDNVPSNKLQNLRTLRSSMESNIKPTASIEMPESIDNNTCILDNTVMLSLLNESVFLQNSFSENENERNDDHVEKNNIVRNELLVLKNVEVWTTETTEQVAEELLESLDYKEIAMFLIENLSDLSLLPDNEEMEISPPMPPMKRLELQIIALVLIVSKKFPEFFDLILEGIKFKLFKNTKPKNATKVVERLSRILIALLKERKDKEKVKLAICDAFYTMDGDVFEFLKIVIMSWPEVFPKYSSNNNIITKTIIYIIMRTYVKFITAKEVRSIITNDYYGYPKSGYEIKTLTAELLQSFEDSVPGSHTAIILLSKKMPSKWVLELVEKIIKFLIKSSQTRFDLYEEFTLLGNILYSVSSTFSNRIGEIIDELCDVLSDNSGTEDFREGIVSCLSTFSKLKYQKIALIFLKCHFEKELRSVTKNKLIGFFKLHQSRWWQQLINENFSLNDNNNLI